MNIRKTKKLTTIGMLCALAYIAVLVGRIPVILFLKYDPKDVIIVIGGFLFGPSVSLAVTLIVSVAQMFTISGTGILGCVMNVVSSCSFACTAALVYQKRHRLSGAVLGLLRFDLPGRSYDALELSDCPNLHGLSERSCCRIAAAGIPAV